MCVSVCVCSKYYFVLQSLHKSTSKYIVLRTTKLAESITSQYKPCTLYFQVQLLTTKLAQSTSQCYFVLQSLHKDFPVLLCTTQLAQSTSQYYSVLQSLHKVLPNTTSYYKACTKYFPVLLRTAQSTSQYYILRTTKPNKVLPSTISYYKACAKYFPITCQNLGSSSSNAKWKPGSPNTMAQRKQPFKDHFRTALTLGNTRAPNEPSCTRHRTDEVPHIDAGSHFARENTGLRAISTIQTWPRHSSSAMTASQITLQLRRPPRNLSTSLVTLSISNLSSSLLSPSLICPHPYSHHLYWLSPSLISNLSTSLWLFLDVIIYGCDCLLLLLFTVVTFYCCDYLWLCFLIVVIMFCCDAWPLWLFIVVIIHCCVCLLVWCFIVVILYGCD